MTKIHTLAFDEQEIHALEVILSCVDANKLVNTSAMALSLHRLKLSDIFLTIEKMQDYIQTNIKRDDE